MSEQRVPVSTVDFPIHPDLTRIIDEDIESQPPVEQSEHDFCLEVQNLKMYFPVTKGLMKRKVGEVKAVDDVSFAIRQGETLGIVGESGSGKSTIGNCIVKNLEATSGKILFQGRDIAKMKGKEFHNLRRQLTVITQDPFASLDPRATVEQSILEGVKIHKTTQGMAEQHELVCHMMGMVGLNPDFAYRFPHEFSGGQRQRISIARALAMNPSFIVCDEIVSALDVSIQAQIVNLIMKLQKELNLTYLFIGHDLSVVRYISNYVAVMYLGQFMEYTSSDELYNHPLHPYTQALISAAPIPKPEIDRRRDRILLEGEIPSPIHPPEGCKFCTRCRYADKRCRMDQPELVDVGNGHLVACHRVAEDMGVS